jgi:hypothetical protein
MKIIFVIFSVLSSFLIMAPATVSAQNSNYSATGNDLNNTGGLSPESVNLATSNGTNQALNTTDSSNNTGGLSPESVTEAKY